MDESNSVIIHSSGALLVIIGGQPLWSGGSQLVEACSMHNSLVPA